MSYRKNLGKVIGKEGKVYIPQIVERDNKKYITWVLTDEQGAQPNDIDITPKAYLPSIDNNGNLSFVLTSTLPASIPGKNIRGPKGYPGEVDTTLVESLPPKSSASEGIIYIHDGIATVYDAQTNEFYDLDNLVKFDNYYTKIESNERFYTKTEVNNMFGNITQAQEAIIYTLDKGSVNIPNGD